MWILSFVPDAWLQFAVYCILISGVGMYVVSFFLNFIPPALPYKEPIRIMGTLLAIAGIWFHGGAAADAEWRAKAADLQNKIAVSEAQSKDNNVRIKTVYVDRVKVVKETQVVIQEKIKEIEKHIDSQCTVDTQVINILNDSAKRKVK